ncbi:protein Jade-1 isoform X3 [Oncorhynchus kisutch]|nr:protein Jade-1-like isoform X3 [Oncorhynchus kisutch]XP_031685276.1 protein Jade-1-like isoform X3 [Oncorhynchus kisutch]
MKRSRHPSSSEEDSDNGSNSTSWSQHSQPRRANWKKPSEVFRTDFITAMKLHDTYQLNPEDYYVLADPWRQEWEKGVQVPVSPHTIPQPVARGVAERGMEVMFSTPKKWIRSGCSGALGYVDIQTLAEGTCRYDLNDTDVSWLELINQQFTLMGMVLLDEMTMERVMEEFERRCYDRMSHAMATEEGLGMEYDEDVVCDICRSPDSEDNNEMVFCDKCNICVHQACYGILKVPKGSWLCRTCDLGISPKCQLCPKKGGAMKPTRSGTKWVHVSCALWIPEVSIGNPEKMEPITNMSHIPSNRWALTCCLCKDQTGACIQCSAKSCRTAFHVSCALQSSLEMNTILTEQDEVKFKSFCPKHSGLKGGQDGEGEEGKEGTRDKKWRKSDRVRRDEVPPPVPAPQEESRVNQQAVNLRQIKLQQLEEQFYQFVDVKEVANHLQLPQETVDFLYQYWKLKRRANHSQPLLTPQKEEEESLARREHDVLLHRLQLFTHLRQDLERARNLTYMVTRREKIKRTLWRIQEQIFTHQAELLDHEIINGTSRVGLGWLSRVGLGWLSRVGLGWLSRVGLGWLSRVGLDWLSRVGLGWLSRVGLGWLSRVGLGWLSRVGLGWLSRVGLGWLSRVGLGWLSRVGLGWLSRVGLGWLSRVGLGWLSRVGLGWLSRVGLGWLSRVGLGWLSRVGLGWLSRVGLGWLSRVGLGWLSRVGLGWYFVVRIRLVLCG